MAKKATKRKSTRRKAAKRKLIDTGTDKRPVRCAAARGQFKESDDVGKSSRPTAAKKPSVRRSVAKVIAAIDRREPSSRLPMPLTTRSSPDRPLPFQRRVLRQLGARSTRIQCSSYVRRFPNGGCACDRMSQSLWRS